ncbi:GNAT family N-acetyltransferase [Streptococcus respiraculi]|uniref:GNAT family N-acetyltransferase n=1 Tax=Streptococcus respiraculi TaxID=2021971 RepID=UPI000E7253F5|nr:GNAT family N-acetyltransferase [Streptococcus respiraculi]
MDYLKYIETSRLIIRPLDVNDYHSWLEGFNNRHTSMSSFDDGKLDMSMCDEQWYENLVNKHRQMRQEDYQYIYGVFDKLNNHIGMIDIVTLERGNFQWGEIGYFIHNQYWRRGYAYEALQGLLQNIKKLQYHRIEAHVSKDNKASKNLLIKLGFKFECTREQFILENDSWTDKDIYIFIIE